MIAHDTCVDNEQLITLQSSYAALVCVPVCMNVFMQHYQYVGPNPSIGSDYIANSSIILRLKVELVKMSVHLNCYCYYAVRGDSA